MSTRPAKKDDGVAQMVQKLVHCFPLSALVFMAGAIFIL
jgi:hypothetical protein